MFYDNKYFINCNICPRQCNANRYNRSGTCSASDEIEISSIVIHKGEEPIISGKYGILNVFFLIVIFVVFIAKIIKLA